MNKIIQPSQFSVFVYKIKFPFLLQGLEFVADIREAVQTSVFDSFDMVDWNPLKVNKFFSSTCMHVF